MQRALRQVEEEKARRRKGERVLRENEYEEERTCSNVVLCIYVRDHVNERKARETEGKTPC